MFLRGYKMVNPWHTFTEEAAELLLLLCFTSPNCTLKNMEQFACCIQGVALLLTSGKVCVNHTHRHLHIYFCNSFIICIYVCCLLYTACFILLKIISNLSVADLHVQYQLGNRTSLVLPDCALSPNIIQWITCKVVNRGLKRQMIQNLPDTTRCYKTQNFSFCAP